MMGRPRSAADDDGGVMRGRAAAIGAMVLALGASLLLPVTAHAAPTPKGPRLTFAQFNACKAECDAPAPAWGVRRDRVARVIIASGADVVGVDEATDWTVSGGLTQWQDIQALVAPAGYAAPVLDVQECLKGGSCAHTAKLLYRTSTVSEVDFADGLPSAGSSMLGLIAPGIHPGSAMREFTWAYLQGGNGTGPFLAIAIHMDNDKEPAHEPARRAAAAALGPWVDARNRERGIPSAPAVLMADLNSNSFQNPKGAQKVLKRGGWVDAWTAPVRRNTSYSTINLHSSNLQFNGFPPRPVKYSGDASRIDYIFGRGVTPVTYEVVMHLTRSGGFDRDYQASDHQMVKASFAFPRR